MTRSKKISMINLERLLKNKDRFFLREKAYSGACFAIFNSEINFYYINNGNIIEDRYLPIIGGCCNDENRIFLNDKFQHSDYNPDHLISTDNTIYNGVGYYLCEDGIFNEYYISDNSISAEAVWDVNGELMELHCLPNIINEDLNKREWYKWKDNGDLKFFASSVYRMKGGEHVYLFGFSIGLDERKIVQIEASDDICSHWDHLFSNSTFPEIWSPDYIGSLSWAETVRLDGSAITDKFIDHCLSSGKFEGVRELELIMTNTSPSTLDKLTDIKIVHL